MRLQQKEWLFRKEALSDTPYADATVVITHCEDVDWLLVMKIKHWAELHAVDAREWSCEHAPGSKIVVSI